MRIPLFVALLSLPAAAATKDSDILFDEIPKLRPQAVKAWHAIASHPECVKDQSPNVNTWTGRELAKSRRVPIERIATSWHRPPPVVIEANTQLFSVSCKAPSGLPDNFWIRAEDLDKPSKVFRQFYN